MPIMIMIASLMCFVGVYDIEIVELLVRYGYGHIPPNPSETQQHQLKVPATYCLD